MCLTQIGRGKVHITCITPHPNQSSVKRQSQRYLTFELGGEFCSSFEEIALCSSLQLIRPPQISTNLNADAERLERPIKKEYLSHLIIL